MTASDYPITTDYGQIPGYPLNGGFHRGQDRAMPTGTPILVNGTLIGLSGNTGASTGSHLHIGRWVGGQPTNPQGGGFNVAGAVVSRTGSDDTNGNFVAVKDADGSEWVYLHLSKILVKAGQPLEGNDMLNYDQVDSMAHAYLNDSIANNPGLKQYVDKPAGEVIAAFNGAPQRAAYLKHIEDLEKQAKPTVKLTKGVLYEVS